MLKILLITFWVIFITGCSTVVKTTPVKTQEVKKPIVVKHQRFQTVAKEKAILLQDKEHKESCYICGMNLVKFYKTSHAASEMGKVHQYCSLHCLTKHLSKKGVELENPIVVDVASLKFIPVQEAYYVVGSSKPATMSRVSKYAFKSLKDAKKFQKENGGKIVDFYTAWQLAKKDFQ
ncbi:nitrous oxide reductase accessory protein NosL [Sulfurimonas sp.]|uniref:nitrous oxide reductase accessory protein NosL n=1 Tax=Sulfurimonas sp. TaxID=2022749 RepID=UPI0026112781|nr:nitrous oxide reductase accessory protein NosL [Sulfurimonas sp.]